MVVLNRIAYLHNLILHGAKGVATIATNPVTQIENIKIVVYTGVERNARIQRRFLHVLDMVETCCKTLHVVDKGNRQL